MSAPFFTLWVWGREFLVKERSESRFHERIFLTPLANKNEAYTGAIIITIYQLSINNYHILETV